MSRLLKPTYQLKTLFLVIVALAVPLAYWASPEHRYRERVAALRVLWEEDAGASVCVRSDELLVNVGRGGGLALRVRSDEPPIYGRRSLGVGEVLKRNDVVVEVVNFGGMSEKKLSALLCFTTVTTLDLSVSDITDAQLGEIAKLPRLENLDLQETGVTDAGVRHLAAARALRVLDLSRMKISGAGLARLSSLRRLDIRKSGTTDAGLAEISKLPLLEELYLQDTGITDAGVRHLAALMPELRVLEVAGCKVGDESLAALGTLPHLKSLNLAATLVSDAGLSALRELKSLEYLDLDDCAISDAGMEPLSRIRSLKAVCLGRFVSGDGVDRLKAMRPDLDVIR